MASSARDFYIILQVSQAMKRRLDACLDSDDLTPGQYMILSMLGRREPLSSAELARLSNVSAQAMGEFIKALEARKLVQRSENPTNRRIIQVQLTSLGKTVLARVEKLVDVEEDKFFSGLSERQRASLRKSLIELRAADRQRDEPST